MTDEFGATDVFSEARLAALKVEANHLFTNLSYTIKKSESALFGIVEFLKTAEQNERAFHKESKNYVEALKAIELENSKVTF